MKTSAGLLMYKIKDGKLYIFLVHPGGPLFVRRDNGFWSIPKGLTEDHHDKDKMHTAVREFMEETGIEPKGELVDLGSIVQKNNKRVYGWAFEGDIPDNFKIKSNKFKMEWPPKSGNIHEFDEVDRGQFFVEGDAKVKMNPAQVEFIERLKNILIKV